MNYRFVIILLYIYRT